MLQFSVCVCPPAATPVDRVIALLLEYGKDFSGPGEDVFRSGRATGRPEKAHTSNFLHPVFYYYQRLPTGGVRARPAAPVRHRAHFVLAHFSNWIEKGVLYMYPVVHVHIHWRYPAVVYICSRRDGGSDVTRCSAATAENTSHCRRLPHRLHGSHQSHSAPEVSRTPLSLNE